MKILKVSAKSKPNLVAGAIVGVIKEDKKVTLQAVGEGAINQAVKAIAIARGFIATSGVDLVCIPAFAEIQIEGEERTGIKFIIKEEK